MTNKKQSTESTFIYAGDTSIGSLGISRIQPKRTTSILKGLSFSLENLRNPFPQTLPLKFPKKRIVRGGKSHMLSESIQPPHKPCIRPSQTRNKHDIQVQPKQGIRITHKTNETSQDNNIYQAANRSVSNQSSVNKSVEKQSKRIFHHMVIKESVKDPILIGQIHADSTSRGKRKFQNESQRKNHGQGTKSSLDWRVNKSDEKLRFSNKCKAVPQLQLAALKMNENECQTQRNTLRTTQRNTKRNTERIKQRLIQQNTQKISQKTQRQPPMTARKEQKPKTYLQMYNSRRVGLK